MKYIYLRILWIFFTVTKTYVRSRPDVIPVRQDMPLDVNKLDNLGHADALMKSLKEVAQKSHNCGLKEIPQLTLYKLRNQSVTCNDGSPAGYYMRKSHGSKKWIVFLEGGWYCFDTLSCRLRWQSKHMRSYMSSLFWPAQRPGTGFLSWDPKENPYYFNANIVYVPYCSSDSWTGTSVNSDGYAFLGSLIVEEVIRELIPKGLHRAKKLILAGSSAGGTGVLMNIDRVADLMKKIDPRVEVRGVADSGWFVDNKQYRHKACTEPFSCAPADGVRKGIVTWKGRIPDACAAHYPESEHWRCYFGYVSYPLTKTPVFIVQYLFDEAQITVNNLIDQSQLVMSGGNTVFSQDQWEYLFKLGEFVKNTLRNVTAVFAPACLSHELLLKRDWQTVAVENVNLAQSIYCWENSFAREKCLTATTRSNSIRTRPIGETLLKDAPISAVNNNRKRRKRKKKRKNSKRKNRKNKKRKNKRKRNKKRRRRNRKRKNRNNDRGKRRSQRSAKHVANCSHHLIERCPLPQWCNGFCPAFRNRFTGEVMDFFQLFAKSGIDKDSIADMLDIDQSTIKSMNVNTISDLLLETFRRRTSK